MPQMRDQNGFVMPGVYPNAVCQKVAYDGNTQSTALSVNANFVRLVATTAVYVKAALDPTASADGTSMLIPAATVVIIPCVPGGKIAAIKHTTAGDLAIMEIL